MAASKRTSVRNSDDHLVAVIVQKGKPPAVPKKVTMLIALSILDLVGPLPPFLLGARIYSCRFLAPEKTVNARSPSKRPLDAVVPLI